MTDIDVCSDQGYRGHDYTGDAKVDIVRVIPRNATRTMKRMLRRRSSIESSIGHMKAYNRLQRNHLTGKEGDRINALLAAVEYNLHKLLQWLFSALFQWLTQPIHTPATAA